VPTVPVELAPSPLFMGAVRLRHGAAAPGQYAKDAYE
jgi:hypothetical protein